MALTEIQARAAAVLKDMTPEQMALRIAQLESDITLAEETVRAADAEVKKGIEAQRRLSERADAIDKRVDDQLDRIRAIEDATGINMASDVVVPRDYDAMQGCQPSPAEPRIPSPRMVRALAEAGIIEQGSCYGGDGS